MNIIAAIVIVSACLGAGLLGTLCIRPRLSSWYGTLRRPSWAPPQWLFAPVWSFLYMLMAAAAWIVWSTSEPGRRTALGLFAAQLVLNLLWPILFFGLRRMDWAFVEIMFLWVAVAATTIIFWGLSPLAGFMMVPYLAWVSFAVVLNGSYWRLNP